MGNYFSNALRDVDKFGKHISVTYKGDDAVRTRLGGVCTLVAYILILINFVRIWVDFVDFKAQSDSYINVKVDALEFGKLGLATNNLDFMFMLQTPIPKAYGEF